MDISKIPSYKIGLVQANAYRNLQQHFRAALAPYKISIPEWSLLGMVYDSGPLTLTEITEHLKSKASHPTVLVDNLAELGLLNRQPREDDRRVKVVTVTPKGGNLVPEIERAVRISIASALQHISRQDLEIYYKVLSQIAGA